jgi:RNA polymerase sigma factor (sigma-70 family)
MGSHDESPRPDELLAQLGWVRALARRLVADPEVTDDVLQQVCLLALQQPPDEARTGPRLRAWLATATRHLALHATRADGRRRRREQAAAQPEALPSTADVATHREALRRLVEAVTSLEEPSYSVIVARYFDGRSVAEIAAASGASKDAVRQRLSRARQQLRVRLQSLLAGDRPGRLWAALPLAPLAASLKLTPAKPLLPHLRGFFMAKSTTTLVTAACVGLALTGGVLFLRGDGSPAVDAPLAVRMRTSAPDAAAPALSELSAAERDAPARLELEPEVTAAPAPAPAADRLALPAVPASEAWNGLFKAADDLAFGNITQEGVVDLAFALLAQLPADAEPELSHGYATYELLAAPGMGTVRLIMDLETPRDGITSSSRMSPFTIEAMLDTRPGAYTGNAADQSRSTKVDIAVVTDGHGALNGVTAVSFNMIPGSRELWEQMSAAARIVPIGGAFRISSESTTWSGITHEATGTAEEPGFMHRNCEPVARPGTLADPRTQLLHDVLADRRRKFPQ